METKRKTVAAVSQDCPTLSIVVAQAKADGNITVKNSPGRNLHRLLNTLKFISSIFKGLRVGKTLKDAVSDVCFGRKVTRLCVVVFVLTRLAACPQAYDTTLGLLHSWLVRTGIKAGMLGLPTREHFLQSIGETVRVASTR